MEPTTGDDTVRWEKVVGGGTSWFYLIPQRTRSPLIAARHEDRLTPEESSLNGKTVEQAMTALGLAHRLHTMPKEPA